MSTCFRTRITPNKDTFYTVMFMKVDCICKTKALLTNFPIIGDNKKTTNG